MEQQYDYGSLNNYDETKRLVIDTSRIALNFSESKCQAFKTYAEEGQWTWKIAGFIAGLLIVGVSFLSLLSHFFGLSWFLAVLDIYFILFGIVTCILEYKEYILTEKYINIIKTEALFLYRPYGRAAFYIFIGILFISQSSLLYILVGLYTVIVGIIIYNASKNAIQTLESIKSTITNENDLETKFKQFDFDHSGYIDRKELSNLLTSIGYKLTLNELESAIFILDKNSDGKISYDEFLKWWVSAEIHKDF